jgi:hypothetical protein
MSISLTYVGLDWSFEEYWLSSIGQTLLDRILIGVFSLNECPWSELTDSDIDQSLHCKFWDFEDVIVGDDYMYLI